MKMIKNKIIKVKSYFNANELKAVILKENKNKSGIYRWNNLVTGKSYIGSAKCLRARIFRYYSLNYLNYCLKRGRSTIYSALLKHGYENFSLDILEYCETKLLLEREQYYIYTLKPEYNILKIAGSRLGHKLSEETRLKLSKRIMGNKHPGYGKSLLKGTREKLVEFHKCNKMTLEAKNRLALINKGITVKIYDNTNNLVKKFTSIKETAEHFNVGVGFIRKYLDNNKNFQGFILKSEIKNNKVGIFNTKNELVEALDNAAKISKLYNIPRTTLHKYIKTSKLYKDKYYFYKIN